MSSYIPMTCVWEVTMGCNMRCKHCGSSCTDPLPDELTTEEALALCDQFADLGMQWVTLSGGEPLTRKDWPAITERLNSRGIVVNLISNGWLIDDQTIGLMRKSGLSTLALSLDGPPEVHDRMRRPGAYKKVAAVLPKVKKQGITCGVITTVTKENLHLLNDVKERLIALGADSWQLQIGLPMGNLAQRPEWLLDPGQMDDLMDFCYQTSLEGRIIVYPADCIGYYSRKEQEIKKIAFKRADYPVWDGCNAGVRGFGVLHNGDILGCTSIRNTEYVEGNIREKSLASIWNDENAFAWRRKMKKEQLSGDCGICKYGDKCLGGCPNTRLTLHKSIYAENDYCVYNTALKRTRETLRQRDDASSLFHEALRDSRAKELQSASLKLERLIELRPDDLEAYRLKGFTDFMIGNYAACVKANEEALRLNPGDAYARKGLGMALHRLGRTDEGVGMIEKVLEETAYQDGDALHDLMNIYHEAGRPEQAQRLMRLARKAF